jgi:NAD(P)-dependent dehydrogenase (short-subunit alcohol dehydrogenase family)
MAKLKGKAAIVVGAGRGLGRSIAIALAKEGADVALAARTESEIESTASAVRKLGVRAIPIRTDATNEEDVRKLVQRTLQEFSKIDILVNCQGESLMKPTLDTTTGDWERVVGSNLKSVYLTCKAVLPSMIKQKNGHIFNTSTRAALYPTRSTGLSIYKASKMGVIGFSKVLAAEMKGNGIKVNVLCPGPMDTPMRWKSTPDFDKKRAISPDMVAEYVVVAASQPDVYLEDVLVPISTGY